MSVTIYHNPQCSKSRATLALICERGIEPSIIEYLKTPPSADELRDILKMLGVGPQDILRKSDAEKAGIDASALDDDALIAALIENPSAIQRPIVLANKKAAIGRPPEAVLDIL
jgi:arsenate reductase (glutaredoxin)